MADEISVDLTFSFIKGLLSESKAFNSKKLTVAGDQLFHNVQEIGVAEEALALGDMATRGLFVARNLNATNKISIRAASAAADLVEVPAGGFPVMFIIDVAAAAPFAIAAVAPCQLEYWIIER